MRDRSEWSSKDDALLADMFRDGKSYSTIGRALARSYNSVRGRIERLRTKGVDFEARQAGRHEEAEDEGTLDSRSIIVSGNTLLARLSTYHARRGNIELARIIEAHWSANNEFLAMAEQSQKQARRRKKNALRLRDNPRQQEGGRTLRGSVPAGKGGADNRPQAPAFLSVRVEWRGLEDGQRPHGRGDAGLQLSDAERDDRGGCEATQQEGGQPRLAPEKGDIQSSLPTHNADRDQVERIIAAVSTAFAVSVCRIKSPSRGWHDMEAAKARMACYAIMKDAMGLSYSEIGRIMSRDHSTILHGIRKVPEYMADPDFAAAYTEARGL